MHWQRSPSFLQSRPVRVLLISHTCQSRTEGQPKAEQLARFEDLELRVLVPDRWKHYGKWRAPDVPPGNGREAGYAYQVSRVRWPWAGPAQFYLHYYPDLAATLEEFRPDVIDLWEEPWALVSAHACRLRNRLLPGTRVISETEQNIDKRLPPPFEQLRRYTLRNADFAVCRSAEAMEVLRNKGFTGPAEVVPNGVDAELFRPMDRVACRRALQLDDGFWAGYVGRLVEQKGLTDLVDALPRCPPDVRVLFVGAGPLRPDLEARARQLGVADRVRMMEGRPLADLPQVMNALDVFVLPSRTTPSWKEQFGRVIIEANACGVPVIGTRSGAISDVIGEAGIVVPERSPDALADALMQLREDLGRAGKMGERGRWQVETLYTWQRVAARMYSIYHSVYQRAGAGS